MKSHFSFVPLLLALWTTTLLCFGHLPLARGQTFCIDSTADPKVISSSQFAEEAAVVRTLIEWFANRTALADLTSGVEVSEIKQEMEYSWIPENLQPVVGEGSWVVVTKSTSQVLLDTSSSAQPPAAAMGGPGLNYETTKAMLCSHLSQQPLIFNHYGNHTSNMYTRSYSQALQTSLDYEWYAISVRVRGSLDVVGMVCLFGV